MVTLALVLLIALVAAMWVTHRRHTADVAAEWFNIQFVCCILSAWPVYVCWEKSALNAARRDFAATFLTVLLLESPLWWLYQSQGLLLMSLIWLVAALYEAYRAADDPGPYQNFAFAVVVLVCLSMIAFPFFWRYLPQAALITAWSWYGVAAGFIAWRMVLRPWVAMVQDYQTQRRAEWSID